MYFHKRIAGALKLLKNGAKLKVSKIPLKIKLKVYKNMSEERFLV